MLLGNILYETLKRNILIVQLLHDYRFTYLILSSFIVHVKNNRITQDGKILVRPLLTDKTTKISSNLGRTTHF